MKTFIKLSLVAVFAMMFSAPASAASSGSCQSAAASLSLGNTVTGNLVDEYDPDYGENTGYPVYYFKLKVNRGDSATLVMSGESPYIYEIYEDGVYEGEGDSTPPSWEDAASPYAAESRFILRAGDWDEDSPKSVTYYVVIDGNVIGDSFSLQTMWGEVDATLPQGVDEDTAVSITPKESFASVTKTLTEAHGSGYYFKTQLTAGQKYYFGTYDNTTNVTDVAIYGLDDGSLEPTMTPVTGKIDGTQIADDTHAGYCVIPSNTATYVILVSNKSTDKDPSVTLHHKAVAARQPKDHPLTATLGAIGSSGASASISPAYRNNPASGFFDAVIDDALVSVTLEKGKKYLFVVDSLTSDPGNLIMELCDSKGDVRVASKIGFLGEGVVGPMFVYGAEVAGVHYVGVCQNTADSRGDESPVAGVTGRLSVSVVTEDVFLDEYDLTAGDPNAEITPVTPAIGKYGAAPEECDVEGQTHNFGLTDWKDTVSLPVRKGITYSFSVTPGTNTFEYGGRTVEVSGEGFAYAGVVYTLSGKTKTVVKKVPDLSAEPLSIQAGANTTYYLEITKDGQGVPAVYSLHSMASAPEGLGYLTVNIHGPTADEGARWYLKGDSSSLNNVSGTTVLLPADSVTVKFTAVKGFSTAADMTGTVKKDETTTFDAYYNDTADPLDDWPDTKKMHPTLNRAWAPTKLSPTAAKPVEFSRSLWVADSNDWYVVSASKEGVFYKFAFVAESEGGDARIAVFGPNSWTEECAYVLATNKAEAVQISAAKGTYYICVSHADPAAPKDTSYTLRASMAEPGQIKFSAAEYKVKDNAAEVKLTVNRTAKGGRVRVNLWTEDGAFAQGINRGEKVPDDGSQDDLYKFYKEQQTLVWENGDNKAKTVVIKLIPDKYPTFHDFVRSFKVKMEDAYDGSDGCYPAVFAIDSKTKKPLSETQVTLQESAKKTPGTVQVDDRTQDVKKPVYDVRAGETLTFNLARVNGDDGDITVKVDTSALTGTKGDFLEKTWADGEFAAQKVEILVPPATDAKTSKKVTLKLSATSKDKPKFAASSITVNVLNDKFALTMADYAKALPKTCGYTIKEGKAGTWVVADDGSFVNSDGSSALTFTITGPARFSCKLDGAETSVDVTVVGKTQTFVVPAGVKEVTDVRYDFNFGNFETVFQAVQYGYGEPIVAEGAVVKAKVSAGKLPDGIKLEQDKATKAWYVRGVPTKAGFYFAEIQDTAVKPAAVLTNLAFEVVALRTAVGTFNGLATNAVEIADGASTNSLQSLAQVTLTTAASGKLSAKVAIGGKTYNFTATGFSKVETGALTNLTAELTLIQKVTVRNGTKSQSLTYTNVLTAVVCDRDEADRAGWNSSADVALTMAALPDMKGSGLQTDRTYGGRVCRDNSKQAAWVTEASQYAGYYTIALAPAESIDGAPQGNGYLTLTLDAKGKVKIAGALANGTAYSASSVVGNMCTVDGDYAISVPLYSFKSPTLFGGWLTIRFATQYETSTAVAVLDEEDGIRWISQDAAATYDGKGFELGLEPVGGYYDTVASLQRYYLNNRFEIEFPADDDMKLLQDILVKNYGAGYDFVAKANPNGMPVDVVGDTVSVAKQVLVKELDYKNKKTNFNDWKLCTNAANVKVTFKRATGILTGTCDLWYEGTGAKGRVQNKLSGLKHAGVLLVSMDATNLPGLFDKDTWTAGAVVIPQSFKDAAGKTRKWNASFPFNIKAEEFGED